MPMAMITAYIERLPAVKAEYSLMMSEPISLPHLKTGDRRRVIEQLRDRARGPVKAVVKAPSPGTLALIGIKVVKQRPQ